MTSANKNFSNKNIDNRTNLNTDDPDYDIIESALNNDFAGIDAALQSDVNVINFQRVETGITALMAASSRGLHSMVDYLLSKPSIALDIRDKFGNDALDHARFFPNIVGQIMNARTPGRKWKEPRLGLVPD